MFSNETIKRIKYILIDVLINGINSMKLYWNKAALKDYNLIVDSRMEVNK